MKSGKALHATTQKYNSKRTERERHDGHPYLSEQNDLAPVPRFILSGAPRYRCRRRSLREGAF